MKDYDFPAIKTFRKKVVLPSMTKWKIAAEDTLIAGKIQTMIKHKGFFYNSTTKLEERVCIVTKQGYMIVYSSEEKGYLVDIPEAVKVTTCTTTLKTKDSDGDPTTIKRTDIEIKMRYGSVMLSSMGKEALPWIEAVNRLVCPSYKEHKSVENRLSCQLDALPNMKRESLALDYSMISDNSISIHSPLLSVKKRAPKSEEKTERLSITPTPKKRLSPLMPKKVAPKLEKQEEVEDKKEDESKDKRRNTMLPEEATMAIVKTEERKASAPAIVSEESV